MMIVGICGFINSGKGTVGDILQKRGFKKSSFADPLKDAVSVMFDWDRNMLEGITEESRAWREQPDEFWSNKFNRPFTPREALQLMGTEAGRNIFHPDVWVWSLMRRERNTQYVMIPDVRFKNEIKIIRENNGIIIRVKRGDDPDWYPVAIEANKGNTEALLAMNKSSVHISEWDWIGTDFDYVIENNGSIKDLENSVNVVLNDFF